MRRKNSEFKPVKLRLKIDLVSYPARVERLGKWMIYHKTKPSQIIIKFLLTQKEIRRRKITSVAYAEKDGLASFLCLMPHYFHRLLNAKASLIEKQQWYYLTQSREDEEFHTFPEGINPKINVIERLEFELANFEAERERVCLFGFMANQFLYK